MRFGAWNEICKVGVSIRPALSPIKDLWGQSSDQRGVISGWFGISELHQELCYTEQIGMYLIIAGLKEVIDRQEFGQFFCQVCDDWCEYELRVTSNVFTLFFINTHVPWGDPVERVICQSCGREFNTDALRYHPKNAIPRPSPHKARLGDNQP